MLNLILCDFFQPFYFFSAFLFVSILFLTILCFYSPVVKEAVLATEKHDNPDDEQSSISLAVPNKIIFDRVTPTQSGTFTSAIADIIVKTNSQKGYALGIFTGKLEDGTSGETGPIQNGTGNALVKTGFPSNPTSPKVTSNFTGSVRKNNFPKDSWGYSINSRDFLALPKQSEPHLIRLVDEPVDNSNKTTRVTFGAKISTDLPYGTYRGTVGFVATSEIPSQTIFDITTMQEMKPELCHNTTTPTKEATELTYIHTKDKNKVPRTILKDLRDGKKYLVSKLADGNCWMSQNLELDLDPNKPLTADNTDLGLNKDSTWIPDRKTQNTAGIPWDKKGTDGARSYHPPKTESYYQNGITKSDKSSHAGDPHYAWERTGNYYNWIAATAGSGTGNYPANNSICPKGWELPYGGKYGYLFETYGFLSNPANAKKLTQSPFNMLRSGLYNWYDGVVYNQGINGYLPTGYFDSNTLKVMHLDFNTNNITPLKEGDKGDGLPVRCIAVKPGSA